MSLKARITLLLALGACAPTRPEGAYTPVYAEAGPVEACKAGFDCEDEDAGDVTPGDDGTDDMPDPELDASEPLPDADVPDVDPSNPLRGLAGRYLMRVDYYSTVSESEGGTRLTLKNRVSNLFLTELFPTEGRLVTTERLCFQSSAHQCLESCRDWKTSYSKSLWPKVAMMSPTSRAYIVDAEGNLSAESASLALGFDDDGGALPKLASDPRVWKLSSSSTSELGVPTNLTGSLSALNLQLSCEVDSVLRFGTAFKAKLPTLDAAGLSARIIEVNTTGTEAYPIVAVGRPTQFCDLAKLQGGGQGSEERVFVRFKKTNATACPASATAFETQFAITENLDPPTPTDPK